MDNLKKKYKERYSQRVEIRLTPSEEHSLKDCAKESGLSLSDFVRSKAIGSKPRLQHATPERTVFIKLLAEFGKIGSNINQIAKALNSDLLKRNYSSISGDIISDTLNDLQTLSAHVINVLTHGDKG